MATIKRVGSEAMKRSTLLLGIGLVLTALLRTNQALALEPTNETVNCLPGQTANSDLGVCVDPICGPGTQRDPSGNTRYCVQISCPPGMQLDPNIQQCVPVHYFPPGNRCPDGSIGQPERLSTGVTVIVCPHQLPPPPPPRVKLPVVPGSSILRRGVESEPTTSAPTEQEEKATAPK